MWRSMGRWLLVCALLAAQSPLSFEVATIKPSGPGSSFFQQPSPDRFVRPNTTLTALLLYAYDVSEFQVQGGPEWMGTARFAVEGKAEGEPTAGQMQSMVKQLLADRFNLRVHTETRDLPRYALVRARSDGRLGDKLRPSASDCPTPAASPNDRPPAPPQPREVPRCGLTIRMGGGTRMVTMNGASISRLIRTIQPDAGRVVVDKTGLTGSYDIELETELVRRTGLPTTLFQADTPREGLSLFTALQEQLGLKLESERGPVDLLIVDRAEKPTAD